MSYTHLTTTGRVKIEIYLELGMSIRSIARRLGRQPSTVSREIRRNPGYESGRAQRRYEKAKTNCGVKTKLDDTIRRTIVEKLRATWSPEQVVGWLFNGKLAFSTIYPWIYSGRIGVPVYFADPYVSWQRGSNENANGLLREFFPKGTDFAQVGDGELADALAKINGRPRKCLGWRTAHEVFTEEVLRLI